MSTDGTQKVISSQNHQAQAAFRVLGKAPSPQMISQVQQRTAGDVELLGGVLQSVARPPRK
jgi:hypothetical protein